MKNKQLNILFFVGSIDWGGGTERSVSLISSYLAKRNFNVKVLSFFDGHKSFYKIEPKVELLSLNMKGKSPVLQYIKIAYTLRKLLKEHQIDVVIITDVILSLYVFPAIARTGIKTIYRENFNYFTDLSSRKRKFSRAVTVKYTDFIVTITTDDQKIYESKMKNKGNVTTIYNVKPFKTSEISNMDQKVVVTVGKLVKQKGFDMLLCAWSKVINQKPEWKLQIVGGGIEERKILKQFLEICS